MSRTVLITGANAGLGFASARQLASNGRWDRVILTARSRTKAEDARDRLVEITGRPTDSFGLAIFDNNLPATVLTAVDALAAAGEHIDAVILNAGGVASADTNNQPPRTEEGYTRMFGMNLGGHIILIDGLVSKGLLSKGATVMLAGSEAARGIPVMGIKVPTLPEGFGEIDDTLEAVIRGQHGGKGYDAMIDYGFVKLIGTVWMRQLAEQHGLRALTVSPGFTAGTEAMDKLPWFQKLMFSYVALPIMRLTGNAHGLDFGAARYVQALEDDSLKAGNFYASAGGGISGALALQGTDRQPLLEDKAFSEAVGRLLQRRLGQLQAAV